MFSSDEWTGRTGDVWADEWRRTDRSFAGLSPHLNAAILALASEHGKAVDLGCGAGETAIALARARPDLAVSGVDISHNLIAIARERGRGIANLDFSGGRQFLRSMAKPSIDLLVSRHGVMFFDDPGTAFARIHRRRHAWRAADLFVLPRSMR